MEESAGLQEHCDGLCAVQSDELTTGNRTPPWYRKAS